MGIHQMFFGIPNPSTSDLYSFTTFTFTNAGVTGSTGPNRTACLSSYNTTLNPWLNNTEYFDVVTTGIQLWTVPSTGSYSFTIEGAAGGFSNTSTYGFGAFGRSASFTTTLSLTQGHKLRIAVGQMGSNGGSNNCGQDGSGGGGTFIYNDTTSTILAVAGGGGGAGSNGLGREETLKNASNSTSGNKGSGSNGGAGGTGGNGGSIQTGSCVQGGGAGAGLSTNGAIDGSMTAAQSFLNNGAGGTFSGSFGGFGGGGVRGTNYAGGGGGGYSGGGGGGLQTCSCNDMGNGGAGGSYSVATITSFSNPSSQTHGSCIVTKL